MALRNGRNWSEEVNFRYVNQTVEGDDESKVRGY